MLTAAGTALPTAAPSSAAEPSPQNRPPTAVTDTVVTPEGTTVVFSVTVNDTDPDGDALTLTSATDPERGTVSCLPWGQCTFAPDPGATGEDSFTYTVSDGRGGVASGAVRVTVTPVAPPNRAPVAAPDAVVTVQGTAVTFDVLANDTDADADPLGVAVRSRPAHGTVDCSGAGRCRYLPAAGFSGSDTFGYTVSDGRGGSADADVTLTVTPVGTPPSTPTTPNHAPRARADAWTTTKGTAVTADVLANDTDVDGDPLTVTSAGRAWNGTVRCTPSGSCTYAPRPGFTGTDAFTYTVTDGRGASRSAGVLVTVEDPSSPTCVRVWWWPPSWVGCV
ncbi:Ig-like domain-containing protein [Kineosporia sp. R_H_3]|uniref:Ig-like domain-containing protein n=1 Tax=Kineosporia sp. R_H_3 TaxID=1961848 RepID=UPI00117B1908|nr:Ig-like domain-containing protein [Kineosporia sp. R_H_3]